MLKVPQVFKNIQDAMTIYNYQRLQAFKTQSAWDLTGLDDKIPTSYWFWGKQVH
jgi:hypothetical protein